MTRWHPSLTRRLHALRAEKTTHMRRTLTRVRHFAMRGGLRGWDPYPLQPSLPLRERRKP